MAVVEVGLVAVAAFVGYREYKAGKLAGVVADLKADVESLESKAKAEASKVVTEVKADIAKAKVAVEAEVKKV